MSAYKIPLPHISLYRKIAWVFVIFTILLVIAVFFSFYNKATIIVTSEKKEISLSFNLEAKTSPTAEELEEKDVISGQLAVVKGEEKGNFSVLSTSTVDSLLVGRVKILNESSRNQPLLKTTQLQDSQGTIVRTNQAVVVPAGKSVVVDVYPADPKNFVAVEPGRLTIIKLNKNSQDKIYGLAETRLIGGARVVKVFKEADFKRAQDELSKKIADELRKNLNLRDTDQVEIQITGTEVDKKIGVETSDFNLSLKVKAKALDLDYQQLANLIGRKIGAMDLSGLTPDNLDFSDLKYTILDDNPDGSVLVKVEYTLGVILDSSNQILAKSNFVGKSLAEAEEYLRQSDLVKEVEVYNSPFWSKKLPRQEKKIKIIVK
ncbi:MAG: hypothetical protein WC518_02380 [Patescibacteria group bacterium]